MQKTKLNKLKNGRLFAVTLKRESRGGDSNIFSEKNMLAAPLLMEVALGEGRGSHASFGTVDNCPVDKEMLVPGDTQSLGHDGQNPSKVGNWLALLP